VGFFVVDFSLSLFYNTNMNTQFWNYFTQEAEPLLALRAVSFRKMFEHLDTFTGPVTIVETGCLRQIGNWAGDGQSTLLFDKYVTYRNDGSKVYSVDIDAAAVDACKSQVSSSVTVTAMDSVRFLNNLAEQFVKDSTTVELLYLDSYDVDWTYWFPSAAHHLKELVIAQRFIDTSTLVVVDDCGLTGMILPGESNVFTLAGNIKIGGKGRLIAELAEQVGLKPLFSYYQAGWLGFASARKTLDN